MSWQPLESYQRRVLGVLVEKAKTTPENYPLSLNALRNGCNQKSNRYPQMQLEEHQVDDAIEELRKFGAVSIIQGDGRVEKYRHLGYEWLGVEKVELAVMAELLLRGAQTVGELRGRAARMEPIKGLSELTPILDSLLAKNLIQYLTPPGRGAVLSHNLYLDRELDKLRRDHGGGIAQQPAPTVAPAPVATSAPEPAPPSSTPAPAPSSSEITDLRAELTALRAEMQEQIDTLRGDFEDLRQQLGG